MNELDRLFARYAEKQDEALRLKQKIKTRIDLLRPIAEEVVELMLQKTRVMDELREIDQKIEAHDSDN